MSALDDKPLICKECKHSFVFTAGEQQYFAAQAFSPPARCKACRAARKRPATCEQPAIKRAPVEQQIAEPAEDEPLTTEEWLDVFTPEQRERFAPWIQRALDHRTRLQEIRAKQAEAEALISALGHAERDTIEAICRDMVAAWKEEDRPWVQRRIDTLRTHLEALAEAAFLSTTTTRAELLAVAKSLVEEVVKEAVFVGLAAPDVSDVLSRIETERADTPSHQVRPVMFCTAASIAHPNVFKDEEKGEP
jgi:hypothetical protein